MTQYYDSLTSYQRISSLEVTIGDRPIGAQNPIRLQSMTCTDTNDIDATVAQSERVIRAGGDYIRITAQGIKEAEALHLIKQRLIADGYTNPIVADIHFNPKAAEVASQYIEKVRINPGNYIDKRGNGEVHYTDEEYAAEIEKIRLNLKPLLQKCNQHGVAIRIGVNHGSLSQRVMSRYGDTPMGLVVSLLEFLQICEAESFYNVVLSIKASNTRLMVQACRLLVQKMKENGRVYPVHLGVTEAGEGEDGRLKSAVGIGTLLIDGIGDTVRVSLTEAPETEIPVARKIVDYCTQTNTTSIPEFNSLPYNPFEFQRRRTSQIHQIGGTKIPVVISVVKDQSSSVVLSRKPDFFIFKEKPTVQQFKLYNNLVPQVIVPFSFWQEAGVGFPFFSCKEFLQTTQHHSQCNFVYISIDDIIHLEQFKQCNNVVFLLSAKGNVAMREYRALIVLMMQSGIQLPVVLCNEQSTDNNEEYQIRAACDVGGLCIDGLVDGICIDNEKFSLEQNTLLALSLLQACRLRFSKTEYISCPSCGRTLFDIQKSVKEIRQRTGHLPNLKIGIMGCIVNGPGEMADADYGFVGAGRGLITLYKDREVVKRNIPADKAVDELIALIKENGDWIDHC